MMHVRYNLLHFLRWDCWNADAHEAIWMHEKLESDLKKERRQAENRRVR